MNYDTNDKQKINFGATNPKEFYTTFSGTESTKSMLAIESRFTTANVENECSPQQIFNDKFSRFKLAIVSKKEAKTGNIPIGDVPDILARTEFIRNKLFEKELAPTNEDDLSPAYTVRIISGEFKGKTPAQILLEKEENKEKLKQQYAWLKANVEKYPGNRKIMEAIMDAANLLKEGKLKDTALASSVFEIYKPGVRPLIRKQREDGMSQVYELSIRCYMDNAYPIEINIQNYYAPVYKNEETGMLNVKVKQRDENSVKKGSVNLSLREWNNILYLMQEQRQAFVTANAAKQFEKADRLFAENLQRSAQIYQEPA